MRPRLLCPRCVALLREVYAGGATFAVLAELVDLTPQSVRAAVIGETYRTGIGTPAMMPHRRGRWREKGCTRRTAAMQDERK